MPLSTAGTTRAESFHPEVDRIEVGQFREGPAYATWRRAGTTDWLYVVTLAGRGRFGVPGAPDLLVTVGDQVLLAPGTRHDYGTAAGASGWELAYAHFHPRADWLGLLDWPAAGGSVTGAPPGLLHLHADGVVHARIVEAMERAVAVSRSGLRHAQLFALNAVEVALLWCATQGAGATRLDPRLLVVVEHVGAHLAEPLTLPTLAAVARLSASRLAHLFAESLGTSPMRYVEQQRMQAARRLLELTTRPVNEVAAAVGFTDPLYFSARFRRDAGVPPSQYRRRATGGDTTTVLS